MLSFLIVLIGLSVLILVHELGHFWAAKWFGVGVEEFGIGFPPKIWAKKIGETIYSLNWIFLGGFVKLYGEFGDAGPKSFVTQAAGKKIIVIVAGVLMNFIAGWLIMSAVFWLGAPPVIMISQVLPGSPAAVAGLKSGDLVLGYQGPDKLVEFVNSNRGKEIEIKVQRRSDTLNFKVTPRLETPPGEGALGIALQGGGLPRQGFLLGLSQGLINSAAIVGAIFSGLYQIVLAPENIVGPVGIFDIAVSTGQIGWVYVLQLLALISLNLAVLNILPIPALDGGRLLFIIIEKIRGRAFTPYFETKANTFGFAFLITLIVIVTLKDIASLL